MAWNKFKITEFGERTTVMVNALPAVLNTLYNKTDVLTVEKNTPHYGEPFDVVKYKLTDGTIESNTSNFIVNVPPDKSLDPDSSNQTVVIVEDTEYTPVDDIPYNTAVDRIKIVSFDNLGELTFEGSNIFPNFIMFHYDFESLKFKSGFGSGVPYQTIQYQVGNADGFNATVFELKYNLDNLGTIEIDSQSDAIEGSLQIMEAIVKIEKGRVNANAKINVDVNLNAGAWPALTDNFFTLIGGGLNYFNNTNFNEDLMVDLNDNGLVDLSMDLNFDIADLPITGTITITLLEIDGDSLLVDPSNDTVVFNITF